MADPSDTDDRRQYFRIKNWIFLHYDLVESIDEDEESKTASHSHIALLQSINKLDTDNRKYLNSLNEKHSQLGDYLLNMNRKFELLTQFVIQSMTNKSQELLEVDISGGGLRFQSNKPLKIDQLIRIELILVPECAGIIAYGRVVDRKELEQNKYEIALVFVKLKETDRDAIVKHVFQVQSSQLRTKAEKTIDSDN
ncbi:PilZ domain-containing protein [Aliikangiella sp. G2MR2-5]|uniref:PilZ domain-containing protein n=1 Tax=Aliikangiella sp. G2MR2-5 TaxID=2788943 RepID=UPI0018AA9C84|nr:PilZ domain-containing protein [Aliikangiella sp. G2MR2-5]